MNRQEAINIVKKNWPDSSFTSLKEALEFLIPELMNTDNEKIKEAIIKGIIHAAEEGCFCADNYSVKECVAWLEKQGKQDMIPLNKAIKFLDEQLVNDKDEITGEPFINFQNYGAFKETFISYFKRKMLEKQGEQKPDDKIEPKDYNSIDPHFGKPVDEIYVGDT